MDVIDLQSDKATSKFKLDRVGITRLPYPVRIIGENTTREVTVEWQLGVSLARSDRATHMSRFVEELHQVSREPVDLGRVVGLSEKLLNRLDSDSAEVLGRFTWFREQVAPVTKKAAFMHYKVGFKAKAGVAPAKVLDISVPMTALCPCSKAISDRGAHNQRAEVRVILCFPMEASTPDFCKVIDLISHCGSAPVYSLLKRQDEKYVTELAYDNPVFIEDLARFVAEKVEGIPHVKGFYCCAKAQESIHGHDCFAELSFGESVERGNLI